MNRSTPCFATKNLAKSIMAATLVTSSLAVAANDFAIEEIVVTAQKREQNLQDVPVAISAFSGEFLNEANITTLNKIVAYTPGLAGQNDGVNSLESFSVRGLSTGDFGLGGDLSVGVYENGIYRPSPGALGFYDLDRVEILKGPQGLLFGRNATSGAISVATRRPGEELDGNITVGLSERNGSKVSGAINIPLIEDLYMRIAGQHEEERGYVKNITTGNNLLGSNRDEVRTSFRFEGFENTTIDLILDYSDIERTGGEVYKRTQNVLGQPFSDAPLVDIATTDDVHKTTSNLDGSNEGEYYGAALEISTDLSGTLTLTSLTGFRSSSTNYTEDFDGVTLTASHANQSSDSEYFSQEFRINSDGDNLTWFAGISAYDQNISGDFNVDGNSDDLCRSLANVNCILLGAAPTGSDAVDGLAAAINGFVGLGGDRNYTEASSVSGESKGWAVFGEATLSLTDTLDLSIGARYTYDEKTFERNVLPGTSHPAIALGGFHGGYFTDGKLKNSDDWSDFSPRIALRYSPTEGINYYASVSKGYKAGGFNSFGFANTSGTPSVLASVGVPGALPVTDKNAVSSFDPEGIINYEVGMKSRWLDNQLQFNASIYHYNYEDMQLVSLQSNAFIVQNIGEASGQGVELDIRYLPSENWDLFFGAAYSDTETKLSAAEEDALCDGDKCDGNRLPYNPRLTTISMATFHTVVTDNMELFVTAEHSYETSSYSALENLNEQESDSIELINLRAGLRADGWSLTFYVENLEDKAFYRQQESSDSGQFFIAPSVPRTSGVELSMDF